jgi:hypothetical protein
LVFSPTRLGWLFNVPNKTIQEMGIVARRIKKDDFYGVVVGKELYRQG